MATHLLSYSVYESLFLWHLKHHSIISFPPLHVWVFFFSTSWLVYAEEVSTRFGLRCPSLHYASWVSHSFVLFWRTERALCVLIHWFKFKLSLKNEELKMRCEPAEMLAVLTSVCRHNTDIMNISVHTFSLSLFILVYHIQFNLFWHFLLIIIISSLPLSHRLPYISRRGMERPFFPYTYHKSLWGVSPQSDRAFHHPL